MFFKRFYMALLSLFLVLLPSGLTSVCQAGSKNKDIMKECKKVCKQMKAEGWEVYGQKVSLEDALVNYYQMVADGNGEVETIIGKGEANSSNQAMTKAMHHLKVQYASMQKSNVSSEVNVKMTNDVSNSGAKSNVEFDSTFEQNVNQKVGTFKPDMILSRKKGDGKTEIQVYLIVKQ